MSTTVCSKCGASLTAGAGSCPSCGQVVAARPAPPASARGFISGKRAPLVALAVLGGGLVVLLGALALFRSGATTSGTAGTTAPVDAVGQSTPATSPSAPSASTTPATSAPPVAAFPAPGTPTPATGVQTAPGQMPRTPASGAGRPPTTTPVGVTTPPRTAAALPPVSKTYECRESAVFNVSPDDALVTVDGKLIGKADDWDDMAGGKKYKFASAGTHYVRLSLDDHKTVWIKVVVAPSAEKKTADVDLELKKK